MVERAGKTDLRTQHGFVELCRAQATLSAKSLENDLRRAKKDAEGLGFWTRRLDSSAVKKADRLIISLEQRFSVAKEIDSIVSQASEIYFSGDSENWHLTLIGPGRLLRKGFHEGRPYEINSGFDRSVKAVAQIGTKNDEYTGFFALQYQGREVMTSAETEAKSEGK